MFTACTSMRLTLKIHHASHGSLSKKCHLLKVVQLRSATNLRALQGVSLGTQYIKCAGDSQVSKIAKLHGALPDLHNCRLVTDRS